jgi:hypothetical protein
VLVADLAAPEMTALDFHVRVEALVEIAADATGHLVLRLFRNTFRPAILAALREIGPHFRGSSPDLGEAVRALDAALATRSPEAAASAVRALSRLARGRLERALDAYEAERARRSGADH